MKTQADQGEFVNSNKLNMKNCIKPMCVGYNSELRILIKLEHMGIKFKSIMIFGLFVFSFLQMHGQNNRYYYDYEMGNKVDEVSFNTPSSLKFVGWESDNLLFEYYIQVSNIPKKMYNSLLKTPRYQLKKELDQRALKVFVDESAFKVFSSSSGQIEESIILTVYYPKEFKVQENQLVRK